jgi:heptosyltransferase-2
MKPKLLVVECWGLGDLAIATPFLQAACKRYDVTLLAKPYALDLQTRFWPEVKVIPFTAPWTVFHHKYQLWIWPWLTILHTLRQLAHERFDVGLSARWDPRDHLLLWLVGVRQRVGFNRAGSGVLLSRSLPRSRTVTHQYEFWRRLAEAVDLTIPARAALPPGGPRRTGGVLIHTGAGQPVRVWPMDRYQRLARQLRQAGYAVRIACDTSQRAWWLAAGEAEVVTPSNVTELLRAIDAAACIIANDSGPGHLAAFCGLPTLTLFGPQLPDRFAPLSAASECIEGWACPHRPCSDYCRFAEPRCLLELSEKTVAERALAFVGRHLPKC